MKKIIKKKSVKKVVKKAVKKPAKKTVVKIKKEKPIGTVTHYYGNLEVGILKFNKPMKAGEKIRFKGATTDFEQIVKGMQYDHKEITVAKKGQEVGMKVEDKVRDGDEVFEAK